MVPYLSLWSASYVLLHDLRSGPWIQQGKTVLVASVQVQRRNTRSINATCHHQLWRVEATIEFVSLHLLWQRITWLTVAHEAARCFTLQSDIFYGAFHKPFQCFILWQPQILHRSIPALSAGQNGGWCTPAPACDIMMMPATTKTTGFNIHL